MRCTLAAAAVCLALGCSADTVAEQDARGRAAYVNYCQACHETERGIGPRLTSAVLASRMSTTQLFAYNRDKMPYNAGNTLTDQQYWDITAHLVWRHDLVPRARPLGNKTADTPFTLQ